MELTYPVLCLSRDSSIAVADSAESLQGCNALAFFNNRYYDGLMIIDSPATRFRVSRAEVVTALSRIGCWTARVFNRRLRVELQLEAQGSGSLDEAKQIVDEWLGRAPDFWEASRDITEWKHLIARAPTATRRIAPFSRGG